MTVHFPVLMVVIPLVAALLSPLITRIYIKALKHVVLAVLGVITLIAAYNLCLVVSTGEPIHYHFGNWAPPYGIEFVVDYLSAVVSLVVAFVSFVAVSFARPYLRDAKYYGLRLSLFYTLYLLITAGLLGVVLAGDIFTMYVFIEIASISCYGLIAFGGVKATTASFRYLLIGTIGASFYLLGVAFIYSYTGSLNMAELAELLPPLMDTPALIFAVVMLVVGLGIKSALFPLHSWLPDCYTYGPPPAIVLIASTMTKVFAYAMFRFLFTILGGSEVYSISICLDVLGWLAAAGIIYGSVMAIAQKDLRRMLAYSSVAQVNYLPLALAIGTPAAIVGFVMQIISHALTKSSLFMVAGGIRWRVNTGDINELNGLSKIMPITSAALIVGSLSMIGIPITTGFFAKWHLASGAAGAHQYIFVGVLILSGLMNAVYFFRLLENVYLREPDREKWEIKKVPPGKTPRLKKELPLPMLIPIVCMCVAIVVVGIASGWLTENILQYVVNGGGII